MARNLTRAILGILFAAMATWAVNMIVNKMFGTEQETEVSA